MKIIIEVKNGMVTGAYYQRSNKDKGALVVPDVFVVDLDGVQNGDATVAEAVAVEPLKDASDIVIDAMRERMKQ